MSGAIQNQRSPSATAALCVEREAFDRFRGVLGHMLVGLVDQALSLRLVSADPRIETLTLGPVKTVIYDPLVWPLRRGRTGKLLEAFASKPPSVVHAISGASYRVACIVAEAFDAELVLQVTSLADCGAAARVELSRVGCFIAFTEPIRQVLENRMQVSPERLDLIRPGVLASHRIACFARPQPVPTLLCPSPLERGRGVDRLIEAVHILHKRKHAFMLFLLGQGKQESALRRMIRERRLFSFVALARPSGDITQVMRSADIFIQPAAETAFAEDILQAMASGMAVVTVRGAVDDYSHDGETAVVCEKCNAETLAGAVEQLLTDRPQAQRIAKGGMEYVREYHAVSNMAQRTADVYRRLTLPRTTFSLKE